jgi:hypothetical protein
LLFLFTFSCTFRFNPHLIFIFIPWDLTSFAHFTVPYIPFYFSTFQSVTLKLLFYLPVNHSQVTFLPSSQSLSSYSSTFKSVTLKLLFYLPVSHSQGNLFPCSHTPLVIYFWPQLLLHIPYITGFLQSEDGGSRFLQHVTTSLPRVHSITSLNTGSFIVHCVCQTLLLIINALNICQLPT